MKKQSTNLGCSRFILKNKMMENQAGRTENRHRNFLLWMIWRIENFRKFLANCYIYNIPA